jgi:hypothetical protein
MMLADEGVISDIETTTQEGQTSISLKRSLTMTQRTDPARLREAADRVEAANAAEKEALEKANAARIAEAEARNRGAEADAALNAIATANGSAPPAGPVSGPVVVASPGNGGGRSNWGPAGLIAGVIAGTIAFVALLGLLFWLASRTSGDIVAVQQVANTAQTAAQQADRKAGEAKAAADKAAADAFQAKADAANAITIANEAKKAAADCGCDKRPAPKPKRAATKPAAGGASQIAKIPPAPPSGRFWGWIHPEATAANKRACFADRQILGMPAQCSSVDVFPRQGNESEVEWNGRVAAMNGIAVGVKDAKGTITGTRFGRVEVR